MKSLVIGHPNVFEPKSSSSSRKLLFSGREICYGLINTEVQNFDASKYPNSVLIKKLAFSCNYRDKALSLVINDVCIKTSTSDNYIYSGFGSEFVAVVIAVGVKVRNLTLGDRVIPNGAYPFGGERAKGGLPTNFSSELFSIIDEEKLVRIPDSINNEVAACLTIAAQTVYSIVRRAEIREGQSILITAASSNTSLFAMETLKQYNLNIVGLTNSPDKADTLIELGYNEVIISPHIDPLPLKDLSNRIGGFDVVIDPFYDLYLTHVLEHMNYFSKYFTCGFYRQDSSFDKADLEQTGPFQWEILKRLVFNNISIIGNCLGTTEDLTCAITDIAAGRTKILIDRSFSGEHYIEFIERTFLEPGRLGKVVYCY